MESGGSPKTNYKMRTGLAQIINDHTKRLEQSLNKKEKHTDKLYTKFLMRQQDKSVGSQNSLGDKLSLMNRSAQDFGSGHKVTSGSPSRTQVSFRPPTHTQNQDNTVSSKHQAENATKKET